MRIEIKEGMKFQSLNGKEGFTVVKNDYYGDGELIFCAETEKVICPLDEIVLSAYIPQIDGVWINEKNEYIY